MPHYFFDYHDGYEVIDDTGQDFANLETAESEAMRIASEYAADPKMLSGDGGAITVAIRQGAGAAECTIRLVYSIERPSGATF